MALATFPDYKMWLKPFKIQTPPLVKTNGKGSNGKGSNGKGSNGKGSNGKGSSQRIKRMTKPAKTDYKDQSQTIKVLDEYPSLNTSPVSNLRSPVSDLRSPVSDLQPPASSL